MAVIDEVSYGELLAKALPKVIETEAENERMIVELEALDSLPKMTPEQKSLAELMTVLIEQFEKRYEFGSASPLDALKSLMEDRGLRQRDLISVFGSSSVASDVVLGKRAISKTHARRLAEYFDLPVSLFV
jgi:HTH-type transcriptional regulator/antitoxin HigA